MTDSRLEGPIDPDEARLLLAKGEAAAIDLRDAEAMAEGHAPGAVMVLEEDLSAAAEKARAGKDIPILVFCDDGERSQAAAAELAEAGIEAAPVDGGWSKWASSGQPIQPSDGPEFEGPDLSSVPGE